MPTTTLTSREFNHDLGRAKRAAREGPVVVTDRGKPAHVLLSYDDYQRLRGSPRNLVDALAMNSLSEIDFDPPPAAISIKAADLD